LALSVAAQQGQDGLSLGRPGVHAGLCGMEMAGATWLGNEERGLTLSKCECFLLYRTMKKC